MTIDYIKENIRDVVDFPKPGILFKDITTALKEPAIFHFIVDALYDMYKDKGITKIACIESRGFIIGAALAFRLGAGFIPIRKKGKLPAEVYSVSYQLEYGTDTLQIHKDAIAPNDVVLLHDDVLATGGSVAAAITLINLCNNNSIAINFLIELSFLNGRTKISGNYDVYSLIKY